MSKAKRYIKGLSEAQISDLERGYRHGENNVFRSHCQAILLSSRGRSVQELMEIFQCRKNTIYDWFNNYEREGIEGLKIRKGRGRKARLQGEDGPLVMAKVEENRRKLSLARAEIERELGKGVSRSTLRRFLKSMAMAGAGSAKASRTGRTKRRSGKRNGNWNSSGSWRRKGS